MVTVHLSVNYIVFNLYVKCLMMHTSLIIIMFVVILFTADKIKS